MTDIFGQYKSQSTRALATIDSSKYADTNKDLEANVRRLNDFVDYMASYIGVMQKGIDKSKQDVIGQVRSFASDFIVLLGGGSLASFNLGDLQYFLPALGALFGFDSSVPFPLNLFQAAEHFFLGYIIPLDSWPIAIENIIGGFMTSLGLNADFIAAVYLVLDNMGRFTNDLMTIFNDLTSLLGAFNIFDFVGGPIGTLWHELTQLLSNFNVANLGAIANPFLATLTPWLHAYGMIIGVVDDFLEAFTGGLNSSGLGGFSNIINWMTDFLGIFGLGNFSGIGSGNVSIPLVGSIPLLGPLLNMFLNFVNGLFGGIFAGNPLTGFFNIVSDVFTKILGLGNTSGLGTGTVGIPILSAIPIIGGLFGGGNILSSLIPGLDASKILTGTFGFALLQPLIDAIAGGFGGGSGLNFGSLTSLLNAIPGVGPLINSFVGQWLGLTGGSYGIIDLVRAITSIPMNLLTGILSPGQASHLNVGTLSNIVQQFLTNPNFDTANSLIGQGVWTWDGTQGPGGGVLTSAFTDAGGILRELFSNNIPVAPGQILSIFGSTKWTGFTGPANSIALTVQEFTDGIIQSTSTIGSIASPGTSGGWSLLSNPTYTVPAGINSIFLRPIVTSGATAGRVWFGKLSVKSTATNMLTSLIPGLDATKIISGQFLISQITSLATMLGGFGTGTGIIGQLIGVFTGTSGGLTGLGGLGSIFNEITRLLGSPTSLGSGSATLPGIGSIPMLGGLLSGASLLTSIIPGLDASKIISGNLAVAQIPSAIPATNILGIGGATDIGAAIQALTDFSWSGFAKITGTGKSFADVANIATATVNLAQNARDTGDSNSLTLAIRNNTSFNTGLHQTEISTFNLDALTGATDPPSFAVTSTSTPISFWNAPDSATRGFVTWYGKGVTNVTAIYIDLYKLNAAGTTLNYVESSGDLASIMGASWTHGIWIMSGAAQVATMPGDTFAFAMRITGSGTHTVAGNAAGWMPPHALAASMVTPSQKAAVRTDGAHTNITMSGITYSGNQMWFGFGINDGSIMPPAYQPRTTQFTTSGTWTPPYWYDPAVHYLDLISVGGGSGGSGGFSNYSTPGGNSVVTIGGVTKQTATGGAAAAPNSGPGTGYGPGNQYYLGTTYVGGVNVGSTQGGSPPGGGGGSGNYFGVVSHGGNAGTWATTTINPGTSSGTVSVTVGAGGAAAPAAYGPGDGAKGSVWVVARAI